MALPHPAHSAFNPPSPYWLWGHSHCYVVKQIWCRFWPCAKFSISVAFPEVTFAAPVNCFCRLHRALPRGVNFPKPTSLPCQHHRRECQDNTVFNTHYMIFTPIFLLLFIFLSSSLQSQSHGCFSALRGRLSLSSPVFYTCYLCTSCVSVAGWQASPTHKFWCTLTMVHHHGHHPPFCPYSDICLYNRTAVIWCLYKQLSVSCLIFFGMT